MKQGLITAGLNHLAHWTANEVGLLDDPPGEGKKATFKDARAKYQSKEGGYMDVDASTIDWSNADLSEQGNSPGTYRVKFDSTHFSNADDALVHGTVTIEPVEGKKGYYQIAKDGETGCRCGKYDFDIKSEQWNSFNGFVRNVATFGGGVINGIGSNSMFIPSFVGGSSFVIRYHGMFKIGK